MSGERLAEVVEELYGLTPEEFTAARNDAAKQLRSQDRALSERVKALRKPATAAWVVNMLVRHDADEVGQLLDLGESLQQAQADLDGEALRALNRQRRKLIAVMAQKGRSLARDLGVKVSAAVAEQVEDTLHAAMIDPDAAAAVRTGTLLEPLTPAGIGSLKVASAMSHTALGRVAGEGGLADGPGPRTGRPVRRGATTRATGLRAVPEADPEDRRREERRRAREAAVAAVQSAQAEVESARGELRRREQAVSDLQAACLQVNGEIDELRRRIDELEDRLEQLDEEADAARVERDEAAEGLALAESALREAQAAVEELPG